MLDALRIRPRDPRRAVPMVLIAAAAMTAWVLLIDLLLFRSSLAPNYLAFFGGPDLWPRVAIMAVKAVWEEVIWRLLTMTALVGALWLLLGRPRVLQPMVFVAAILGAQAVDLVLTLPMPADAGELAYDALRYYAPGLVWGWLYWRYGWATNALAHPLTHVILQPLIFVLIPH